MKPEEEIKADAIPLIFHRRYYYNHIKVIGSDREIASPHLRGTRNDIINEN